jgi:hypothetical protein
LPARRGTTRATTTRTVIDANDASTGTTDRVSVGSVCTVVGNHVGNHPLEGSGRRVDVAHRGRTTTKEIRREMAPD